MNIIDAMTKYKKIKKESWKSGKYIDTSDNVLKIVEDNKENIIIMRKELFLDDTWEKYEDIKKDFERGKDVYFYIDSVGDIHSKKDEYYQVDFDFYNSSNYFPSEALAIYIKEKQLLERDMIKFSYVNNSNSINWKDDSRKYYISFTLDAFKNDLKDISSFSAGGKDFNYIYFESEEVRDEALKLFKYRIDKLLKMSLKFGF